LAAWTTMALFLKKKCRMMENLELVMESTVPSRPLGRQKHSARPSQRCTYCSSPDYYISKCYEFFNLSAVSRHSKANEKN